MKQFTINAKNVLQPNILEWIESFDHLSSIDDKVQNHLKKLFDSIDINSSIDLHKINVIRQFEDHFEKRGYSQKSGMINTIHQDDGRIHLKSEPVDRIPKIQENLFKDFTMTESELYNTFGETYVNLLIREGLITCITPIILTEEEADYIRLLTSANSGITEQEEYFSAHHTLVHKLNK